jgi:hypothetical protein
MWPDRYTLGISDRAAAALGSTCCSLRWSSSNGEARPKIGCVGLAPPSRGGPRLGRGGATLTLKGAAAPLPRSAARLTQQRSSQRPAARPHDHRHPPVPERRKADRLLLLLRRRLRRSSSFSGGTSTAYPPQAAPPPLLLLRRRLRRSSSSLGGASAAPPPPQAAPPSLLLLLRRHLRRSSSSSGGTSAGLDLARRGEGGAHVRDTPARGGVVHGGKGEGVAQRGGERDLAADELLVGE